LQAQLLEPASLVVHRPAAALQTHESANIIRGARVVGIAKPAATREA
jgi:hypothetical protein